MSKFSCVLTDIDGLQWRFTFNPLLPEFKYFAFLVGRSFSCASKFIDHWSSSDDSSFTVSFFGSLFSFPSSELEKFQGFLRFIETQKAAA